jgi:hypothetical protein
MTFTGICLAHQLKNSAAKLADADLPINLGAGRVKY